MYEHQRIVQNAIVFQIVEQGARRKIRIREKENPFARHAHGRLSFEALQESFELHAIAPQLLRQSFAPAHPGRHEDDDDNADDERHVATADDLIGISREEGHLDRQYETKYETDGNDWPAQPGAKED